MCVCSLGHVKDELGADMNLENKFHEKMQQVQRDAAMLLYASRHRPTSMDYVAYLQKKDPHFLRKNANVNLPPTLPSDCRILFL